MEGIELEDGKTSPAKVKRIKDNIIEITIHEGKNRIIRRMIKALGYRMKSLERIKIGELGLSGLKPGKFEFFNGNDKKILERIYK